jgi:hypothetical protein
LKHRVWLPVIEKGSDVQVIFEKSNWRFKFSVSKKRNKLMLRGPRISYGYVSGMASMYIGWTREEFIFEVKHVIIREKQLSSDV